MTRFSSKGYTNSDIDPEKQIPSRSISRGMEYYQFVVKSGTYSMKTVSRRPAGEDVLRDSSILQRTLNRLRGARLVPRGVFRFASHEDADEWMMRQILASHVPPNSKT
jgi:hypothetical protein